MWTPAHVALIKAAAEDPQVQRIFVNAAIKKALCRDAGNDRAWLQQGAAVVGPRLAFPCPSHLPARQSGMQAAVAARCGGRLAGKELDHWYDAITAKPAPESETVEGAAGAQNG